MKAKKPSIFFFSCFAILSIISGFYFYDTRVDLFRIQAVASLAGMIITVLIYKKIDSGFGILLGKRGWE